MNGIETTRPSPIAGTWYPDQAEILAAEVDRYLEAATPPEISGEVRAILAPHAGLRYSGPVAGYAYRLVQGQQPELVAVVSPMHHPYPYPLLTSLHLAYWTPLGEVPVDVASVGKLNEALQARLGFGLTGVGYDPEHSLEIELPFLQRALTGHFELLPVMVRDQSLETCQALGESLAEVVQDKRVLFVASSDLSHFYAQKVAGMLDAELLRRVEAFDPRAVLEAEESGVGFACGRGPLAAVMWAAQKLGANRARVLHHATSGAVTGDYASVVGYGAAVFYVSET
jgi:AmmeMemoRadiSam system protein B